MNSDARPNAAPANVAPASADPVAAHRFSGHQPGRLLAWLSHLSQGLLERDEAVRIALLAGLAGEHVLLFGPPGTAKSELARRLHHAFEGAPYFERLLTRFSTPEELFGPLSLKALEEDRYERLTRGFLPQAGIAFLDEVFKANSAILNALLTLLNEREFDNGSGRQRTPLVSVIGASNEGPDDDSLLAFLDRFLLRVPVQPVSDDGFAALLQLASPAEVQVAPRPWTSAERQALAETARQVQLSEEALTACTRLRQWLAAQGRVMSDRRWRQFIRLMQVAAASEGRTALDALDLWLTPYVAAARPEDVPALNDWLVLECWQAGQREAPWLTRAVEAFERQLELETSARDDAEASEASGKLALARAIGMGAGGGSEDSGGMRLMSAALEEKLRRRYSPVHVAARLAQLDEILADVQVHLTAAQARHQAFEGALNERLWWPAGLQARVLSGTSFSRDVLASLLARLQAARTGFANLPLRQEAEVVAGTAETAEAAGAQTETQPVAPIVLPPREEYA